MLKAIGKGSDKYEVGDVLVGLVGRRPSPPNLLVVGFVLCLVFDERGTLSSPDGHICEAATPPVCS